MSTYLFARTLNPTTAHEYVLGLSQDALVRKDFASAPWALLRVTDSGTFRGSVQLDAEMRVLPVERPVVARAV